MKVPISGSLRTTSSASVRILTHTGSTFWMVAWDLECCCAMDRLSRIRAVVLAQVGRRSPNTTYQLESYQDINAVSPVSDLFRELLNDACEPPETQPTGFRAATIIARATLT